MRRVREHLIPYVSGVSRDKPSRRGCEERETIRTTDNNAGAPCLTAGSYSRVAFNGAGHHEISYRLQHRTHHCRASCACLIVATYKLATRCKMRKLKLWIKHLRGRSELKFNQISRIYVTCQFKHNTMMLQIIINRRKNYSFRKLQKQCVM